MVLPTSTLRALLALSTLAIPILSLPAPIIHKSSSSSSIAKRGVTHHPSELDSSWDDADNWAPHSGWYSYSEDSADWNEDDDDDNDDDDEEEEYWEVDSWDDDDEDYDYDNDDDYEDYNDYDEEWDDEDEDDNDDGEWDDEEEEDWESDDDSDSDEEDSGHIHYYDDSNNNWDGDDNADNDDGDETDYEDYAPAQPASYSPHQTLHSGIGTVYTQDGHAGSCGNHHDDTAFIAALGNAWMHHQYKASECGRRIQVTNKGSHYHIGGKGNTITVTVQDTCASCDKGHVDFSHAAWDALTDGSPHGQIDLEWTWL